MEEKKMYNKNYTFVVISLFLKFESTRWKNQNFLQVKNINFLHVKNINFLHVKNIHFLHVRNIHFLHVKTILLARLSVADTTEYGFFILLRLRRK